MSLFWFSLGLGWGLREEKTLNNLHLKWGSEKKKRNKKTNVVAKAAVSYRTLITCSCSLHLEPVETGFRPGLACWFSSLPHLSDSSELPTVISPARWHPGVRAWALQFFAHLWAKLCFSYNGYNRWHFTNTPSFSPQSSPVRKTIIILISLKKKARLQPCFSNSRSALWTKGFQNIFLSAECLSGAEISRQPAQRSWLSKRGVKPSNLFSTDISLWWSQGLNLPSELLRLYIPDLAQPHRVSHFWLITRSGFSEHMALVESIAGTRVCVKISWFYFCLPDCLGATSRPGWCFCLTSSSWLAPSTDLYIAGFSSLLELQLKSSLLREPFIIILRI